MTVDWMPALNEWDQASETAWAADHLGHRLLIYRLGNSWCWRITTPSGFTMSAILVPTLGEGFRQAEAASWQLYDARQETTNEQLREPG